MPSGVRHANLTEAYLADAFLAHADLTGADLSGADLCGANLTNVTLSEDAPIPDGWTLDPYSGRLRHTKTDGAIPGN